MTDTATSYVPFDLLPHQQAIVDSDQKELLIGGGSAGGKTTALLAAALAGVHDPGYRALVGRAKWDDLLVPGGIIDTLDRWLTGHPGVSYNRNTHTWTFPSGAQLIVAQVGDDRRVRLDRFIGMAFQFVGIDMAEELDDPSTPPTPRKPGWREVNWRYVQAVAARWWRKLNRRAETSRAYSSIDPSEWVYHTLRSRLRPGDSTVTPRIVVVVGSPRPWMVLRFRHPGKYVSTSYHDNPAIDTGEYEEALSQLSPEDRARMMDTGWPE